ncbi:hypothetical protein [Massilia sp. BSC265]|uniref:arsenate reductase/protein-tyrosine-phosphatase family protein n=1 Tax=Massilia sp. BSC265 TaxID=1549812 RepID=UPI001269D320|nr:hypothetical protein [Massilia sp. BSC265]
MEYHHERALLCTGNACRSRIGDAVFDHLAPPGWKALSAGRQDLPGLPRPGIAHHRGLDDPSHVEGAPTT